MIVKKLYFKTENKSDMAKGIKSNTIVQETIIKKIIFIREEKVILDIHLAELYEVETRVLKQAVRRNIDRFPEDFMFELSETEIKTVVSQNVIQHKKYLVVQSLSRLRKQELLCIKCIKKPESC